MNDDVAEMIRAIHKLTPSEGDVIAVKVPPHWDKQELWEVISEIREKGIQIVAFTEEVELSVIKDHHSYLLQIPTPLSEERMGRIRAEWEKYFPKAPLMVVSGPATLVEEPPSEVDTLL
jgi:hypothetical protein